VSKSAKRGGLVWTAAGAVLIGAGILLILASPRAIPERALTPYKPDHVNGETMFNAGGCAACHTAPAASGKCDDPKGGDRRELAGGRCLRTPFGTFYAPNISPDKETGIGGWREIDFVNAMLRGVSPEGRHYYPVFPYTSYQRMSLKDVRDLKAYMDTLPPVRAPNHGHELAFPYSLRRGIGLWKLVYLEGSSFAPDPANGEEINRGAYLAEGPGHCGECHTPRDRWGGPIAARALSGAPEPDGKGRVPNITPDRTGIADWSESDIAYALKTGFTPDFDVLGGSMTKVQENLARLGDADRRAIAAYLKSIPPIASAKRKTPAGQ